MATFTDDPYAPTPFGADFATTTTTSTLPPSYIDDPTFSPFASVAPLATDSSSSPLEPGTAVDTPTEDTATEVQLQGTVDRISSLKARLQALGSKHKPRQVSLTSPASSVEPSMLAPESMGLHAPDYAVHNPWDETGAAGVGGLGVVGMGGNGGMGVGGGGFQTTTSSISTINSITAINTNPIMPTNTTNTTTPLGGSPVHATSSPISVPSDSPTTTTTSSIAAKYGINLVGKGKGSSSPLLGQVRQGLGLIGMMARNASTNNTPSTSPHHNSYNSHNHHLSMPAALGGAGAVPGVYTPEEVEGLPVDPSCPCNMVVDDNGSKICKHCKGVIRPLARLHTELERTRQKALTLGAQNNENTQELNRLRTKCERLSDEIQAKQDELIATQRDLQTMGEKLVDEIEKRAEMQHSKEVVQDELDELTKSLFEEANNLVAQEAQRRFHHEKREQVLEHQLKETVIQWQTDQDQLKELKAKLELLMAEKEEWSTAAMFGDNHSLGDDILTNSNRQSLITDSGLGSEIGDHTSNSGASGGGSAGLVAPEDLIDATALSEFYDFVSAISAVKIERIHSLTYMKVALEEEVEPCLKFGGNPRTSTKKLLQTILNNTCYVEEMSPAQISAMQVQVQQMQGGSVSSPNPASATSPSLGSSSAPNSAGIKERPLSQSSVTSLESETSSSGGGFSAFYSSGASSPGANGKQTPTQAIFNKTVMERLSVFGGLGWGKSNGAGDSAAAAANANASTLVVGGCSTCGRTTSGFHPHTNTTSTNASSSANGATITPQPTNTQQQPPLICRWQFKVSDHPDDIWHPVCQNCRDRLVSVCEFYHFVRCLHQGLYSTRRIEDLFLEAFILKRKMFYARQGMSQLASNERLLGVMRKRLQRPMSPGGALSFAEMYYQILHQQREMQQEYVMMRQRMSIIGQSSGNDQHHPHHHLASAVAAQGNLPALAMSPLFKRLSLDSQGSGTTSTGSTLADHTPAPVPLSTSSASMIVTSEQQHHNTHPNVPAPINTSPSKQGVPARITTTPPQSSTDLTMHSLDSTSSTIHPTTATSPHTASSSPSSSSSSSSPPSPPPQPAAEPPTRTPLPPP
ncbi:hypothetical protein HK102_003019 [Quaeritorhiza haematococci]|nr:hypothetical protein HK102_003019 [Quaeritorhiza haematococci]